MTSVRVNIMGQHFFFLPLSINNLVWEAKESSMLWYFSVLIIFQKMSDATEPIRGYVIKPPVFVIASNPAAHSAFIFASWEAI